MPYCEPILTDSGRSSTPSTPPASAPEITSPSLPPIKSPLPTAVEVPTASFETTLAAAFFSTTTTVSSGLSTGWSSLVNLADLAALLPRRCLGYGALFGSSACAPPIPLPTMSNGNSPIETFILVYYYCI